MKQIQFSFSLLIIVLLTFSACEKEETIDSRLYGTWIADRIKLSNCDDPANNNDLDFTGNDGYCGEQDGVPFCATADMIFREDLTFTINIYITATVAGFPVQQTETENGTWRTEGDKLITTDSNGETGTGTYTINGSDLYYNAINSTDGCFNEFWGHK